jgi:hypothetical protein
LTRQLEVTASTDGAFPVAERTTKRLRSEIRARYGFREATVDAEALTEWLRDHAAPESGGEFAPIVERLEARRRELTIEPPTEERVERVVRPCDYAALTPLIWEHVNPMVDSISI